MIGQTTRNRVARCRRSYLPLFTKSRQFNPICHQNLILQHNIAGFYVQLNIFLKESIPTVTYFLNDPKEISHKNRRNDCYSPYAYKNESRWERAMECEYQNRQTNDLGITVE